MQDWVMNHMVEIIAFAAAAEVVISTIVRWTPTEKDDKVWVQILGFFSILRPYVPPAKPPAMLYAASRRRDKLPTKLPFTKL